MAEPLPPVYFYLPPQDWPPGGLPAQAEDYWQWQCSMDSAYNWSLYNWTLQTYLRLRDSGFPCQLVQQLPETGIIIAHRYSLAEDLQPGAKQLLVCLQADKGRHPYAQVHVVQNPEDDIARMAPWLWPSHSLPLWPQPGLVGRDPARGDRFENIVYLGRERELAAELLDPGWAKQLAEMGLSWQVRGNRNQWNDYRDVDAVLAVRSFAQSGFNWKPPSKLLNAWHAQVPAILGPEAAFQNARQTDLDYLEVTSPQRALAVLQQLRDDPTLRQQMIENGRQRAAETAPQQLTERWQKFVETVAVPLYDRWCHQPSLGRQSFLAARQWDGKTRNFRSQVRRWRGTVTGPLKTLLKGG